MLQSILLFPIVVLKNHHNEAFLQQELNANSLKDQIS